MELLEIGRCVFLVARSPQTFGMAKVGLGRVWTEEDEKV